MKFRVHIYVHSSRRNEAIDFYSKRLGFLMRNGTVLIWPSEEVAIQLKFVDEFVSPLPESLFNLNIEGDLSSLCLDWMEKNVEFEAVYMHPGGLTAVVRDPFGNLMEFEGLDGGAVSMEDWQRFEFFRRL